MKLLKYDPTLVELDTSRIRIRVIKHRLDITLPDGTNVVVVSGKDLTQYVHISNPGSADYTKIMLPDAPKNVNR